MANILIADKLTEEGQEILADNGNNNVDYRPEITPEELLESLPNYEAVVVRSRAQITGPMIEASPKLKVVGRAGVGLDNVDIKTATQCGVIVMNAPEGNTISTAEHTIAMLLSLARNIPPAHAVMTKGGWDKSKFKGTELRGKTLGVVGMGRIGREVAQRMQAFKMKVLGYDPFVTSEVMKSIGVTEASVDEIVEQADFITVHVPLNDQTRDLISTEQFAKLKKGARLVNCARGGIINEVELAKALNEGTVAGAALDVFEVEPPAADHPLRTAKNVVLTPHLAASTSEAQQMVVRELAEQIVDVLNDNDVRNAANYPRIAPSLLERIKPYLILGEKLGSLLSQLATKQGVESLEAKYYGRVTELDDVDPITTAMTFGFLKPICSHRLNYVNARHVLKEHGIEITETQQSDPHNEFSTLVEFHVTLKDGSQKVVGGTLFGKKDTVKLVRVNDKYLDMTPEGHLIVLENNDVPGVIGRVTTCLGDNNINIGQVSWGRTAPGSDALTVISADDDVPEEVVAKLRELKDVRSVQHVVV
jgi:D-3-phosphoglycerate dehydrogenase